MATKNLAANKTYLPLNHTTTTDLQATDRRALGRWWCSSVLLGGNFLKSALHLKSLDKIFSSLSISFSSSFVIWGCGLEIFFLGFSTYL